VVWHAGAAASVPLIMTVGYALFALAPVFMVLVLVYAVRRVGRLRPSTRPCPRLAVHRGEREEKYQAKSLIRHFGYRGGDALSGSLYKRLTGGSAPGRRRSLLGAGISSCGPCWRSHWDAPFSSAVRSVRANP